VNRKNKLARRGTMNRSALATVIVPEEVVSISKRIVARIGISGRAIRAGKTVSMIEVRKAVADAARARGKKRSRA
jgi:hypothetical protein